MSANRSNKAPFQGNARHPYERRQHMQRGQGRPVFPDITLSDILRHLAAGLKKLWVALKYQFHRLTAGTFDDIRLPWYKIAFALIAIFIITKKDIQFSINMKAPLQGWTEESQSAGQMSMAQPISLRGSARPAMAAGQLNEQRAAAYIQRFRKVAAAEMEKFGIPASVKMAQALLESQAGELPAAREANNHFGGPLSGQHFNSAWENWRAHSLLLRNEYPGLFGADTNYKQWADGLQQAYGAGQPYSEALIRIIEKFRLYELDEL